jgi:hypothetical protein
MGHEYGKLASFTLASGCFPHIITYFLGQQLDRVLRGMASLAHALLYAVKLERCLSECIDARCHVNERLVDADCFEFVCIGHENGIKGEGVLLVRIKLVAGSDDAMLAAGLQYHIDWQCLPHGIVWISGHNFLA